MKALKILFWVVLVIIILLVIAGFVLTKVVNPNHYKGQIEKAVYQNTGRHLVIKGDISWSFFPSLGFKMGAMTLSNPKGFAKGSMLEVQSAEASVKVMPLFSHVLDVEQINVNGLSVHLLKLKDGQNNWETAKPKTVTATKAVTKAQKGKKATTTKAEKKQPMTLKLGRLVIENATVSYRDETTGDAYTFNQFNLSADHIGPNQQFPISVAFRLKSAKPHVEGQFKAQALVDADQRQQQYQIENLQLSGAWILYLPKQTPLHYQLKFRGKVGVDQAKSTASVQAHLVLNQLDAALQMTYGHLKKTEHFHGSLQVKAFNLRQWLSMMGEKAPHFANPKTLTKVALTMQFNGTNQQLLLKPIHLTLDGSHIKGMVNFHQLDKPDFTAILQADKMNVADYVNLRGALMPIKDIHFRGQLASTSWAAPALQQHLNGHIQLTAGSTTLMGVDIGLLLQRAGSTISDIAKGHDILKSILALKKQLPTFSGASGKINPHNGQRTHFGRFVTTATVKNGLVDNKKLDLIGKNFVVKGSGTIDLTKQNLVKYLLWAYNVHPRQGADGQTFVQDGPIKVPFVIVGPTNNLRYGVDMIRLQSQLQSAAGNALGQRLGDQLQSNGQAKDAVDHVKKQAQKILRNIFH